MTLKNTTNNFKCQTRQTCNQHLKNRNVANIKVNNKEKKEDNNEIEQTTEREREQEMTLCCARLCGVVLLMKGTLFIFMTTICVTLLFLSFLFSLFLKIIFFFLNKTIWLKYNIYVHISLIYVCMYLSIIKFFNIFLNTYIFLCYPKLKLLI